jgi:hypothetical protein
MKLLEDSCDIDDFAGNNVIVRSLPELHKADIKGLLIDI